MDTTEYDLSELSELMQETPVGANHGRKRRVLVVDAFDARADDFTAPRTHYDLGHEIEADFLVTGGWQVERGNAHRGVLRSDEYVEETALFAAVERELGFTIEDVRSVYRQGRKSETQRELRGLIGARLLALSRSGANLLELAKLFGWAIEPADELGGERCKTMERAVERARVEEGA